MRTATLTLQQRSDLLDGETVSVTTDDGAQVIVTPYQVAHAQDVLVAGGDVMILPAIVDTNLMDEVTLTA